MKREGHTNDVKRGMRENYTNIGASKMEAAEDKTEQIIELI